MLETPILFIIINILMSADIRNSHWECIICSNDLALQLVLQNISYLTIKQSEHPHDKKTKEKLPVYSLDKGIIQDLKKTSIFWKIVFFWWNRKDAFLNPRCYQIFNQDMATQRPRRTGGNCSPFSMPHLVFLWG